MTSQSAINSANQLIYFKVKNRTTMSANRRVSKRANESYRSQPVTETVVLLIVVCQK
ncbi:hypothetical protein [Bacillus marasmi]|uniref:hypothetical protein n=1 Tax=Bacillus marasmi TaxID=1926279 RepID=UPI00164DFD82|nr:hypothetical protein [Bacillus marasmi]